MDRDSLRELQAKKIGRLWQSLSKNLFYRHLCPHDPPPPQDAAALSSWIRTLPFTTKTQLAEDRSAYPPFGSNLSFPLAEYTRFCQSSGTTAGPIPVIDTPASWGSMLDIWEKVYQHAGVTKEARVFFAFSFGPFLGFWTAFDAATRRGNMAIPGGGLSSVGRLKLISDYAADVLCCTPTYAIRLGEERNRHQQGTTPIRRILVAGEPGGSLPSTRAWISSLWNGAEVWDHHGMTETGPVSYESVACPGSLLIDEESFLAEILDPNGEEVDFNEEGELVLTTLERLAKPLIRYRTGDLVRKSIHQNQLCLEGGILGRLDDMIIVRGVNLYPSAVEKVIRSFAAVSEYQVLIRDVSSMKEIEVQVEFSSAPPKDQSPRAIEVALQEAFALRVPVREVQAGTLPRHEFKAKRWIKE
ncbi:MAG: AMP-binding protein [Verrucomicrobiota bacterium]